MRVIGRSLCRGAMSEVFFFALLAISSFMRFIRRCQQPSLCAVCGFISLSEWSDAAVEKKFRNSAS